MAGSLTNYGEGKVLGSLFGGTAFTIPATWYIGLFSVAPSDTSAGTELSGGGYARLAVTNNTTNFPAVTAGQPAVNGVELTLFTALADLSNALALGLFDAVSAGNLVAWTTITPVAITAGKEVKIPAGALTIALD